MTYKEFIAAFTKALMIFVFSLCLLIGLIALSRDKANASQEWTEGTYTLHSKVVKMGVSDSLSAHIITECKMTARDPLKCVKTTVAIYGNESTFGKRCLNNGCWGVGGFSYPSEKSAATDFIKRYNKKWYKHNGGTFFYGGKDWVGKSNYCTSEVSSKTKVGCPNGAKHFNHFYNKF